MNQKLFDLMSQEHGLTLLETEMNDIAICVRETDKKLIDDYLDCQSKLSFAEDVLSRIVLAHKQSSVDWEAMRQAEEIISVSS